MQTEWEYKTESWKKLLCSLNPTQPRQDHNDILLYKQKAFMSGILIPHHHHHFILSNSLFLLLPLPLGPSKNFFSISSFPHSFSCLVVRGSLSLAYQANWGDNDHDNCTHHLVLLPVDVVVSLWVAAAMAGSGNSISWGFLVLYIAEQWFGCDGISFSFMALFDLDGLTNSCLYLELL